MRDLFYLDGFWYVATRKEWVFSVLLKTKSKLEAHLFYQRLNRAERDRALAGFYCRMLEEKLGVNWGVLKTFGRVKRGH